jgi:hypothetical protein
MFRREGSQWIESYFGWEALPHSNNVMGTAVGLIGQTLVAGAPGTNPGRALMFDAYPGDCNGDATIDACDPDCNRNHMSDACEVMSDVAPDCNISGVPDECEAAMTYISPHGPIPTTFGYFQPRDYLWLNQFDVQHGGEVITHIAMPWSPSVPHGSSLILLLYADPNQDRSPTDAVLLASVNQPVFPDNADWYLPIHFARIAIPPTFVGRPGESFFVGAMFQIKVNGGAYPAIGDFFMPGIGRSWHFLTELNTIDINQPGSSAQPNPSNYN